jgi:DUF4097 and DUF4098 domain-containing protein YvlB
MPVPAPVHVTTRSGMVRVAAVEGSELSVIGGTIEPRPDGGVDIRRAPSAKTIEVRCAPDTDITVGTDSGNIELSGRLGAVRVASKSGKILVAEAATVDARAKSGKIEIGTCSGECRIMAKSAAVTVERADRATVATVSGVVRLQQVRGAEVKAVSGKVSIGSTGHDRVSVHSVSGKVEIRVPPSIRPSTRLRSVSGKIDSKVTTGDDFEISVSSVSGTIQVSNA